MAKKTTKQSLPKISSKKSSPDKVSDKKKSSSNLLQLNLLKKL